MGRFGARSSSLIREGTFPVSVPGAASSSTAVREEGRQRIARHGPRRLL